MGYPPAKRLFDLAVSVLLLVLLSPLFLFAFVLIAGDMVIVSADRGSWLYRERRISAGREFDLLKFRVLRRQVLGSIGSGEYSRLYERQPENLTWAGRALKSLYLDELPQLLNVLRGDMSLVGPRPWPVPMVVQQRAEGHAYRDQVPAGWTGPAQVRKDMSRKVFRPLDLDLDYVEAMGSLSGPRLVWHDLKILTQSLRTVARRRGLRY